MSRKKAFIKAFEEIREEYRRQTHSQPDCKICEMVNENCETCPENLFEADNEYKGAKRACITHGPAIFLQESRGQYLEDVVIPKLKETPWNSKYFR